MSVDGHNKRPAARPQIGPTKLKAERAEMMGRFFKSILKMMREASLNTLVAPAFQTSGVLSRASDRRGSSANSLSRFRPCYHLRTVRLSRHSWGILKRTRTSAACHLCAVPDHELLEIVYEHWSFFAGYSSPAESWRQNLRVLQFTCIIRGRIRRCQSSSSDSENSA